MKPPAAEPVSFTDAQGHKVTVTVTRSGLLAIVTATHDGTASGHPILNDETAVKLQDALTAYIGRRAS